MGTQRLLLNMSKDAQKTSNKCSSDGFGKSTIFGPFSEIHRPCGREYNQQADRLSKRGLQEHLDGMDIEIKLGDTTLDAGVFPFPG